MGSHWGKKKVDKSTPIRRFLSAMRCTCVIQSGKDGQWYTVVMSDLKARLQGRLKGQVSSTHYRRSFRLAYAKLTPGDASDM